MKPAAGRLFLVPTPLDFGVAPQPLADVRDSLPLAAIRVAARLDHWVVENAKTGRAFLKRIAAVEPLGKPLQELHITELPRPPKGASAQAPARTDWAALLAPAVQGHDVGLMSEAGMPAIADPGAGLVAAAHAAGITVVPLPGPNSLMLALAASGLNGQSFAFVGYLPVDAIARAARIRELEALSRRLAQTQLMIETPYRNDVLLQALLTHAAPSTRIAVSCGLTLETGWTRSGSVAQWRSAPASPLPGNVPAVFSLLGA